MLVFLDSSQAIFYRMGQTNGGDVDFTIIALPESATYLKGNDNYYTDV